MLAWMSYVIVVSLLLSLAALALERSARVRQKPTRWLWGTSMIASLMIPLIIFIVKHEHGAMHWQIALDAKGTISTARVMPGP
jgi:hypothetical protein